MSVGLGRDNNPAAGDEIYAARGDVYKRQDYLTGFYESLGFRRISEVYLEDGIPHVDMIYQKY